MEEQKMNNNKKMWWDKFQSSLRVQKVQDFMQQMKELGAAGGQRNTCFVYHKNDIVLVANYRACDDTIIGAIMTDDTYEDLKIDKEESNSDLPYGYFAWAYGYGFNYMSAGWDVLEAFKYATNSGACASMTKIGKECKDQAYLVTEYIDEKEKGEYGVNERWNLVGIFNNIHDAENAAYDVLSEQNVWSDHKIDIIPVQMNCKYDTRPCVGASWYIE